MNRLPLACLLLCALLLATDCFAGWAAAEEPPVEGESVSLFNGQDLTGWHADVPAMDDDPTVESPFLIRDEMLVTLGTPLGHLTTDDEYENYRLDISYRFPGEPGNCGILVHSSTPRVLADLFPQSIEVQMYRDNAGDFWCIGEDIEVPNMVARRGPPETWGTLGDKNRRILNLTDGSENPPGEWNSMVIECVGDEVKVWVNGDLVNHGSNCTASQGHISLQAEGTEVEIRQFDLTPITELTANP